MLFNRADPLFRLSLGYIIPATLVTAAVLCFRRRQRFARAALAGEGGAETMVGENGDRVNANRLTTAAGFSSKVSIGTRSAIRRLEKAM